MEAPALPADALLQSITVDDEGRQAGYRIYADGRYETRPAGAGWHMSAPLSPAQLAAVRGAIGRAGLERLEPSYRARGRAARSALFVQAQLGDLPVTIALHGSCHVPAIEQLSADLLEIFRADVVS